MPFSQTFHGFIESTQDILLLIEGCRAGKLPMVNRRLVEKERHAIRSGTVIVFDETETGIKRWTDGFLWSPSRILGNFLVYRELESRESRKINDDNYQYNSAQEAQSNSNDTKEGLVISLSSSPGLTSTNTASVEQREKELAGSLTAANSSYNFKKSGLIKKTIRLTVNGNHLHVVSYYTLEDVLHSQLPIPSTDPRLSHITLPNDLLAYLNQDLNLYHQRDKAVNHDAASEAVRSSRKRASIPDADEGNDHRRRMRNSYDGTFTMGTTRTSTTAMSNQPQLIGGDVSTIKAYAASSPYPYQFHYASIPSNEPAAITDGLQQAAAAATATATLYPQSYLADTLGFTLSSPTATTIDSIHRYKPPFTELPPLCDMEQQYPTTATTSTTTTSTTTTKTTAFQNTIKEMQAVPFNSTSFFMNSAPMVDHWKRNNSVMNLDRLNTVNNPSSPSSSPLSSPSTIVPPTDVSGGSSSSSSGDSTASSSYSNSNITSIEHPQQGYHSYYPDVASHHI